MSFNCPLSENSSLPPGVFSHLMRNLMHNAECVLVRCSCAICSECTNCGRNHGGEGTIFIMVTATYIISDNATLYVTIINSAGEAHARSCELQQQHGLNFLLHKHLAITLAGTKDSTFLGMREISQASALLGAAINITFDKSEVITSVECPVTIVEREVPCPEEMEAEPSTLVAVPSQADSCVLQPLMYILCDDDPAPRAMGRALLRNPKLVATPDSCVLGELYTEVQSVPKLVQHASAAKGALNVVCMFDQNMHWPEGTILGSELVKIVRGSGFTGLIVMQTANDSDSCAEKFLQLGADAVFSKGMGGKLVIPALLKMHAEIIQNPNRHADLITTGTVPAEPGKMGLAN